MQETVISVVAAWRVDLCKVATRISTLADNFGLVRNSPAPCNIYTVISFIKP
jgi:hypothetical protein